MFSIILQDFNLAQICDSGQCFRMYRISDNTKLKLDCDEEFELIAKGRYLRIGQRNLINETKMSGSNNDAVQVTFDCDEAEYYNIWEEYFDLSGKTDYSYIKSLVYNNPSDHYLNKAVNNGTGIRILNQDLWEMIVSFLISQQNNIPRIHKCIENISAKYGEAVTTSDGEIKYLFPTPESLAILDEDALMECNLGYRSKYVVRTAKDVVEKRFNLDLIKTLDYPEAKRELLKMYGVGSKVADCICLFSLHHLVAFPVDTHIIQVIKREYKEDLSTKKTKASGGDKSVGCCPKALERYSGYEGVIQQYIFYGEIS